MQYWMTLNNLVSNEDLSACMWRSWLRVMVQLHALKLDLLSGEATRTNGVGVDAAAMVPGQQVAAAKNE